MEVQIAEDRRWLEISTAPMPDEGLTEGRFTLYVFHDITRQKGLEKMRTEFVANASHELRTPVTIIKGYADTLLEDDKDLSVEERRRFLEKISTHSERLNLLLRDLLFLSRLESTGSALHRERWSVSRLIEDTAESWRGVLEDGQQLHYAFAGEEDIVFADSLRFSQVVMNLLENIRRHAKGFTRIDISTTVERDGVWVVVADDGQGFPEKDLPHIFQRFYRVEKGRSRESGGTGLGLAIVKHIVQEHGGEVSARSQRGQGTRIDIFLPFPGQMAQQTMFRAMRGEKPQASSSTATADRASPPGAATAVKEE
jgi:signal transduction histidine kinase